MPYRATHSDPIRPETVAPSEGGLKQALCERAAEVVIWGTGGPRREFLCVDDMADACVHLMQAYSGRGIVNIGTDEDITIADLARLLAKIVGYEGKIVFDALKPDGTPRELVDATCLTELGWKARIGLEKGLAAANEDFLAGGGKSAG